MSRLRGRRGADRHGLVGPAHLWRMKRDFQIAFLRSMGMTPQDYLLDLGCGTLRGGIPVIAFLDVGHYVGIEVRSEVLREARLELKEAGLEWKKPLLLTPEEAALSDLAGKFDVVWAFSVLIHLSDDILTEQLALVRQRLKPSGRFFANVNIGDHEEGAWQGFPVVFRGWSFYRNAAAQAGLDVRKVGDLRSLGHLSGQELGDAQWMLELVPKT